jgi:hypothetical protein
MAGLLYERILFRKHTGAKLLVSKLVTTISSDPSNCQMDTGPMCKHVLSIPWTQGTFVESEKNPAIFVELTCGLEWLNAFNAEVQSFTMRTLFRISKMTLLDCLRAISLLMIKMLCLNSELELQKVERLVDFNSTSLIE